MKTYVFRLKPGQDLRREIDSFIKLKNIKAACILACVGNLKKVVLRMADPSSIKTCEGTFEIVSLTGTMEIGNSHLHISISDKKGKVFGGHLKHDSIIGTTAEVVIAELEDMEFSREYDKTTGFDELVIRSL